MHSSFLNATLSILLVAPILGCGRKTQSEHASSGVAVAAPALGPGGKMEYVPAFRLISNMTGHLVMLSAPIVPVVADETGITVSSKEGIFRCPYRDTPVPVMKRVMVDRWIDFKCHGPRERTFRAYSTSAAEIEGLAAAWRAMVAGPATDTPEQAASFADAAAAYRADAAAFVLPETARELKVQAEVAVREKRLWDAADRFAKALTISPTWAPGRYNLALVYGELALPSLAIAEMTKYLTLSPDAENARAAQDKIYAWRDKAKR